MTSAFTIGVCILLAVVFAWAIIYYKRKRGGKEAFEQDAAFPTPDPNLPEGDVRKIAFCFLLKNDFPMEQVWNAYFERLSDKDYKVVIHGKPNVQLNTPLAHKAVILPSIETRWGHISLVQAQNAMLKEALKDPEVDRVCILSGQCVPFRSFDELVNRLNKNPKSMFTLYDQNNRFPRFNSLKKHMPAEHIAFHQQWCVLLRKHAAMLVNNERKYMSWFEKLHAPDECVYLTMLKHYGEYRNLALHAGGYNSVTFTHWGDIPYKYKQEDDALTNSHPKTYAVMSHNELKYLMSSKSILFARKFHRNCVILYTDNKTYKPLLDALVDEGIVQPKTTKSAFGI